SRDLARAVARLEESRRGYEAEREEAERERARLAAAREEAEALAEDLRARQRRRWAEDLDASRRFLPEPEARGPTGLEELRRRARRDQPDRPAGARRDRRAWRLPRSRGARRPLGGARGARHRERGAAARGARVPGELAVLRRVPRVGAGGGRGGRDDRGARL